MKEEINTDEMEMPTPCVHCGGWFDLTDGFSSQKWHPNTTICEECSYEEDREIEQDEEIDDLKNSLSDAEWTVNDCIERLKKLGALPEESASLLVTGESKAIGERTFTLKEALDIWEQGREFEYREHFGSVPNKAPDSRKYFRDKFGIDI